MRPWPCLLLAGLAGCVGGITTGPVMAPGQGTPTGVETRVFGAYRADAGAMPNALGLAVREVGTPNPEYASQLGWAGGVHVGRALVFGRVMFDVFARQKRADGSEELSALSPTVDLGVAPLGNGVCVSSSATWEVHYGAPDRLLVGVFVGICGGGDR